MNLVQARRAVVDLALGQVLHPQDLVELREWVRGRPSAPAEWVLELIYRAKTDNLVPRVDGGEE